jgi:superoxide dismutase, Fe-Mn family
MVVDALKNRSLYDATAIFFFSDHGDYTGDYGLVEKTKNTKPDKPVIDELIAMFTHYRLLTYNIIVNQFYLQEEIHIMQNIMIMHGQHQLPPLPYPYNALEPVISERTLRLHHDKHHQSYVNGLNKAEIHLAEARKNNNYKYIKYWQNKLAFNGSGHILHSIFWTIMAPLGLGGQPGAHSLDQINNYFGSFNLFREQFKSAAENVEASGWGILTWQPSWRHLEILQAERHQNLTQWSGIPILACDVWEHSYYLDYQNNRKKFIDAWWNIINWYGVERRLLLAMYGQLPLM